MNRLTKFEMDCEMVPDGYDMKDIPKPTSRNIQILMDKINELIDIIEDDSTE